MKLEKFNLRYNNSFYSKLILNVCNRKNGFSRFSP